jgi:endoglucanase
MIGRCIPPGLSRLVAAAVPAMLALALTSAPAMAGVANGGIPGAPAANPLAGLPWGAYTGQLDEVYPAYAAAQGRQRQLLAKIALAPRMRWFGSWYSDDQAGSVASQYIADTTGGQSGVLSQMAVFRLEPWESAACQQLPSAAQQASYKRWIDGFAAGIGSSRVAMVLQPDLPFADCIPHHSKLPLHLVAYAARRFSGLPHTTVYIDVGASDWPSVGTAAAELRDAGVKYTRGFALGATHYDTTAHEITFGRQVAQALARSHIPNRHFVINTAQNGRGFTYQQYHGSSYDNAAVCHSRAQQRCVTLGIPPTTKVADGRWGLSAGSRATANRYVDAYLWFGRPWLDNQSDPFDLQRSLALAATSPF